MKFFNFSELGSCCRPQGTPAPEPEESGSHASSGRTPTSNYRSIRCPASTKTESAAHWRPALPAISEGAVVAQLVESKSKQMVQKKSPTKSGSMAKDKRYSSTNSLKESR